MKYALTLNVGYKWEHYDALNHSYISYFQKLGVAPILVPNVVENPQAYVHSLGVDGIILTGGNDVTPQLYGRESYSSQNTSERRDWVEYQLLSLALENNLPVFGVCRGMQLINVFFGGLLVQNIKTDVQSSISHVRNSHLVEIVAPVFQKHLEAQEFLVNSFHNQGVTLDSLSTNLRAFALSEEDKIVEGVFSPIHPILGVQWHPERPSSSEKKDRLLIQNFLELKYWEEQVII